MKFIKRHAWAFVTGFAFGLAGWSFMTWQFYAALIPIAALVTWSRQSE